MCGPDWDRVLIEMANLTSLSISIHVDISNAALHGITFRLTFFRSFSQLTRRWTQFLENQPNLAFLELYEPLLSHVPQLPALKNLIATAPLAAQILEVNVVPSIILYQRTNGIRHIDSVSLEKFARAKPGLVKLRLRCAQLIALADEAPVVLLGILDLTLDSDRSWETDKTVLIYPHRHHPY